VLHRPYAAEFVAATGRVKEILERVPVTMPRRYGTRRPILNHTLKLTSRAILLALLLVLPSVVAAKGKKPKKPKPPKLTPEERTEIRKLMMRVVRGRHPARRSSAATSLAKLGPKASMAVPSLVNALKDRDTNVGCSAAFALGKVGVTSKPAVKGLLLALNSGRSVDIHKAAAEALGMIGEFAQSAIPSLIKRLQKAKDGDLRAKAAAALGFLGEKAAKHGVGPLRKALEDEEKQVRLSAAISLVRLGESGPKLVKLLEGAVRKSGRAIVQTRQAACECLGKLGSKAKDAVPVLAQAAAEKPKINTALPYAERRLEQHTSFRRAAVHALGEIGGEDAVAALQRASEVASLAEVAKKALAKLQK
jgi:HEAT repeat protein